MGMELYANSLAACAVWESVDSHLLNVYGFSIIEIVKENPKEKTIHFSGYKGQEIRQRYMDMTYDIRSVILRVSSSQRSLLRSHSLLSRRQRLRACT